MFEPVAYKEKDYICEKCHWYLMIDSGYGYCCRFPPQHYRKCRSELVKTLFRYKTYFEYQYPCIAWDTIPCGEFKERIPSQNEDKINIEKDMEVIRKWLNNTEFAFKDRPKAFPQALQSALKCMEEYSTLKDQIEDLKEDLSCAKGTIDYYEKGLPSEKEITDLLVELDSVNTIDEREERETFECYAKALYKRMRGKQE